MSPQTRGEVGKSGTRVLSPHPQGNLISPASQHTSQGLPLGRCVEVRGFSRKAFTAFIALGTVSLFADWTYEGSRSILGPYLGFLGATALVIGFASIGDRGEPNDQGGRAKEA
ncbi:MAG: hypothetical protein J7L55_02550, partial [Desulfurococcales archaeon]|nr:hypothetical protein [Desulfurococcales archaeon]